MSDDFASEPKSFDDLSLRRAAAEGPDAIALIDEGEPTTYAELDELAEGFLASLPPILVEHDGEPRIGIVARRDRETIVRILALTDAAIPFACLHPAAPPETRTELAKWLGLAAVLDREHELIDTPLRSQGHALDKAGAPASDEAMLALVLTSGSVSAPRGVALSRRAWRAACRAHAAHLGWQPGDRWLLAMPPAHVAGLGIALRCLGARSTIVLQTPGSFDARAVASTCEREEVTLISMVPTMLQRWIDVEELAPPPTLRALLLGGAPASEALLQKASERGFPLLQTYGMSETCGQVATAVGPTPRGCVGRPLQDVEIQFDEGEILLRGPMLFSGYRAATTHAPPFDASGFFHSGDLGHLDDEGRLHLVGRRKLLIISGGENVSPEEVEAVLESCEGVRGACVFGIPDEQWGEKVVAAIVGAAGMTLDPARVLETCRAHLPAYAQPRALAILDALAVGPTGKLERKETSRRAREQLQRIDEQRRD